MKNENWDFGTVSYILTFVFLEVVKEIHLSQFSWGNENCIAPIELLQMIRLQIFLKYLFTLYDDKK